MKAKQIRMRKKYLQLSSWHPQESDQLLAPKKKKISVKMIERSEIIIIFFFHLSFVFSHIHYWSIIHYRLNFFNCLRTTIFFYFFSHHNYICWKNKSKFTRVYLWFEVEEKKKLLLLWVTGFLKILLKTDRTVVWDEKKKTKQYPGSWRWREKRIEKKSLDRVWSRKILQFWWRWLAGKRVTKCKKKKEI